MTALHQTLSGKPLPVTIPSLGAAIWAFSVPSTLALPAATFGAAGWRAKGTHQLGERGGKVFLAALYDRMRRIRVLASRTTRIAANVRYC